jgi:hypothetical protein
MSIFKMAAISKLPLLFWGIIGCVQVDFVQDLLPEIPKKSNSCIILSKSKKNKCCSEIPATRSILFLICTVVTISAL